MITKTKKSISISNTLLEELAQINEEMNISEFIEKAVSFYIYQLKRQKRIKRDMEIISANAERFNKEVKETLKFQADL